jgi:hypothetical protein
MAGCHIAFRKRPFSEKFELNPIYHTPPSGVPTTIKPYEDIILTIKDIRATMQMATILAKPDYELAKNYKKYERILHANTEQDEVSKCHPHTIEKA